MLTVEFVIEIFAFIITLLSALYPAQWEICPWCLGLGWRSITLERLRERVELVASSVDAVCVFSVIPKGRNFGPVGLSVFVEIESVGARLPPVGTDVSPCRNPANSGEFFFPVLAGESFLEQRDCFRDKFLSLGSEQVLNFDIVHFRYLLSGHFAHHNFHLWCLRRE
uniref:Uncharacterized protein n=1 Tax=Siphoviridae sp. ctnpt50 TaxID=2827941 RepID=A0A8S5SDS6_9CAUD|nr:MAG TPA: hypothetical protein [Siphoviridae sp. ctnpt50]